MITVIGLNSAVDRYLEVDQLRPGRVTRVKSAQAWPGGKGVHVAVTCARLGEPTQLFGLVDDLHGPWFDAVLRGEHVDLVGIPTPYPIRSCAAIREKDGRITELLEPGPPVDPETTGLVHAQVTRAGGVNEVAVFTGSLPVGFEPAAYAELLAALGAARVRTLLDASGPLLPVGLSARPALVKVNQAEAEAWRGRPLSGLEAVVDAARALVRSGPAASIVTLGAEGAVVAWAEVVYRIRVPAIEARNPVGAGDCFMGGIAVGLARDLELEEVLRLGAACGVAATERPETGQVDRTDVERLRPLIEIERLR